MKKWALYSARRSNSTWCYGHVVYRAAPRIGWAFVFDVDYRKESVQHALNLPSDVTHLIMKGELLKPEFLSSIKGMKVLWYPDQVTGFPDRQRTLHTLGPHFDLVCYSHQDEVSFYKHLDPKRLLFLPPGACPDLHKNTNPHGSRPVDVGFVGNVDVRSGRVPYLEAFQKAGLPIDRRKLFGVDLMQFYSQCKIVWNLGWANGGIQTRFFEAMGAGAMVLTNEVKADTGSPFQPGTHLATYKNEADAVEQAKYYLAHEEERNKIARQATLKLKEETIDVRLLAMEKKLLEVGRK